MKMFMKVGCHVEVIDLPGLMSGSNQPLLLLVWASIVGAFGSCIQDKQEGASPSGFSTVQKCLWRSLVSPFQRKLLFLAFGFFFKAVVNPTPGGLARSSGCCYPWMCIFFFLISCRWCKIPPWIIQGTVPIFWHQSLRKHLMYLEKSKETARFILHIYFSWGPIFMCWRLAVDSKEIPFWLEPLSFFFLWADGKKWDTMVTCIHQVGRILSFFVRAVKMTAVIQTQCHLNNCRSWVGNRTVFQS